MLPRIIVNLIGLVAAAALVACQAVGTIELSESKNEFHEVLRTADPEQSQLTLEISFAKAAIEPRDEYNQVIIDDLPLYPGRVGEPLLPKRTLRILLPFGHRVESIEVEPLSTFRLTTDRPIQPRSPVAPLCGELCAQQRALTPEGPDPQIYSRSDWYPDNPVVASQIQRFRGHAILYLDLFPVQYAPLAGELIEMQKGRIHIKTQRDEFEEQASAALLSSNFPEEDQRKLQEMVDDVGFVDSYNVAVMTLAAEPAAEEFKYLIITNEAMKNAQGEYTLQDLLNHKIKKGLSGKIVTTEWINQNQTGIDLQEKIRNFIRDSYQQNGTRYVLLAGDSDVIQNCSSCEPPIVPFRGFYVEAEGYIDKAMPSDCYYSNLDGSFNADGDSKWGEPTDGENGGDVDLIPEVAVGRAPVDSAEEISNFVRKTIIYETQKAPNLNYMVGEYLWAKSDGSPNYGDYSMDELVKGSSLGNHVTVGLSQVPNIAIKYFYESQKAWSKDDVINAINNTSAPVHMFNHLGHAINNYTMKFENPDVSSFTNAFPFFQNTQGCYSGAFDNINDHVSAQDAIAEHLVVDKFGAFAVVHNTRYGWGEQDNTLGPSQYYHREFIDALVGDGILQLGDALNKSKQENVKDINGACMRWCYYENTLFGDPETSLQLDVQVCNPRPRVDAGIDQWIGSGKSVQIGSAPSPEHEYSWSPTTALSCSNCAQPMASPAVTATYTLTAKTVCGSLSDEVIVHVNEAPPTVKITAPLSGALVKGQVTVEATASDPDGTTPKVVFGLPDGTTLTDDSPPYSIQWDTTKTKDGYDRLITAKAIDGHNTESKEDSVKVNVCNTNNMPPKVNITKPKSNQTISGTVTVEADASDADSQVVRVEFLFSDGSKLQDNQAPYSVQWDSTKAEDGIQEISAVAYDDQEVSSEKGVVKVIVDNAANVPPMVEIVSHQDNDKVSGVVTVRAEASDQDGWIWKVKFLVPPGNFVTDYDAPFEIQWDTTKVANGSELVWAIAYDNEENYSYDTVILEIQNDAGNQPPTLNITQPKDGDTVKGSIIIEASASDPDGSISKVVFELPDGQTLTDTDSPYSASWDSTKMGNGQGVISATAFDDKDASSPKSSVKVNIQNGNQPPAVSITDPKDGDQIKGELSVKATATDPEGNVTKVKFNFPDATSVTDTTAPYSAVWDSRVLKNGTYSVVVVAYDDQNATSSASVQVTLINDESAKPSVTILKPSNGDTVKGTIPIEAQVNSPNWDISIVWLDILCSGESFGTNQPPYTWEWNSTKYVDGKCTFRVRAVYGNSQVMDTIEVNIQNQGGGNQIPVATITNPQNGASVSGTINISASASDPDGTIDHVVFGLPDGQNITDSSAPYSIDWDSTKVGDGAWNLNASSYDNQGAASSKASIQIIVQNGSQNQPPVVNITSPQDGVQVNGTMVLSASATDTDGSIDRVVFELPDGQSLADFTAPYSISWDSFKVGDGSYYLYATAYDNQGAASTKASVSVVISNGIDSPTSIKITNPKNDALIQGTVNVEAQVNMGNAQYLYVEFDICGYLTSQIYEPPYVQEWNSTAATDGSCIIRASAYYYDQDWNWQVVEHQIAVTVRNSGGNQPWVSILRPLDGDTVSGMVTVEANAGSTDNSVSRVEFTLPDETLVTATQAPYVFGWYSDGVPDGTYVISAVAYDAQDNPSTTTNVAIIVANNFN